MTCTIPGVPVGAPAPGGSICLGCGPECSASWISCNVEIATGGAIPPCAGPTPQNTVNAPGVSSIYGKPAGTNVSGGTTATGSGTSSTSLSAQPASILSSIIPTSFFGTLGQQLALLSIALVLTAIGFYIMFSQQINKAVGSTTKAAAMGGV